MEYLIVTATTTLSARSCIRHHEPLAYRKWQLYQPYLLCVELWKLRKRERSYRRNQGKKKPVDNDDEYMIVNGACAVQTIGRIFAIVAMAKYNKPCARKRSFNEDLDDCLDRFTMDNTSTMRS